MNVIDKQKKIEQLCSEANLFRSFFCIDELSN